MQQFLDKKIEEDKEEEARLELLRRQSLTISQ